MIAGRENDDAEADGGFGGGYDDDEQHKNLAVEFAAGLAESDEGEIDGVEHQLDGHENGDDVALNDEGHRAKTEKNRAEDEVILRGDHVSSSPAGREPGRP